MLSGFFKKKKLMSPNAQQLMVPSIFCMYSGSTCMISINILCTILSIFDKPRWKLRINNQSTVAGVIFIHRYYVNFPTPQIYCFTLTVKISCRIFAPTPLIWSLNTQHR